MRLPLPHAPATGPRASIPRLLVLLCVAAAFLACKSDAEKISAFMKNGETYVSQGALDEAAIEYRNVLQIDPNNAEAHYALAKVYLQQKRGKEAYWELSETVRLDPSNVDARLTLGGLSLIAKNYEEALEQAQRTLELAPDRGSGYILYGQALERLDRAPEAEAQYRKAIEKEPDEASYLLVAAGYYARQGQRDQAEPLLQEYAKRSPGFLAYTSLARFLAEDRSRSADAMKNFQQAVDAAEDKDRIAAIQNLATYDYLLGRPADSVALLEKAIADMPDDADGKLDLIYLLARYYRAQGNLEGADRLIESATAAAPDDPKPNLILSAYRSRKGDLEGALQAAEAALAIAPDDTKAKLRKAELLVDLGYRKKDAERTAEARRIVGSVLDADRTDPDALFVKGKLELADGNVGEAEKALRAAIDSRPEWAQAHFVLGSALMLKAQLNEARGEVARAVELDPSMLEARKMLARLHAALGEHEYAVEQGRAYLAEHPEDLKTRILVAQSLVRLGKRDDAMAELDKIPESQWDAEVLYARARLELGKENVAAARKLLVRAAEKSPRQPEILGTLLAIDRGTDHLPETRSRIEAAVAAEPENAELARLAGALAIATGNLAQAEESLQKATELDPNDMAAYQQLAAFYQASGRLDETLKTYERALAQRPKDARLHHFVAVLYEVGGRVDDAMKEYEKAIELDPDMAQSKNNLAYLLAESGKDLDRALDLAQQAKAAMPDSGNAADTLGWVLYKRGVSSAAVGYLKEAVATIDPDSPNLGVVRHHLAQAYAANDQTQEAITTLEVALADLEQRLTAMRARGDKPVEPEWSRSARDLLARLKPAG